MIGGEARLPFGYVKGPITVRFAAVTFINRFLNFPNPVMTESSVQNRTQKHPYGDNFAFFLI
jgi:hypothetical protein